MARATTIRFSSIGRPDGLRQAERLAAHAGLAGRQHPADIGVIARRA